MLLLGKFEAREGRYTGALRYVNELAWSEIPRLRIETWGARRSYLLGS